MNFFQVSVTEREPRCFPGQPKHSTENPMKHENTHANESNQPNGIRVLDETSQKQIHGGASLVPDSPTSGSMSRGPGSLGLEVRVNRVHGASGRDI